MPKPKLIYNMPRRTYDWCFCPLTRRRLADLCDVLNEPGEGEPDLAALKPCLGAARIMVGGWDAAPLDEALLALAPELALFAYSAGSCKGILSREVFRRGIKVTSNAAFNGIPVAEYNLGAILMALKRVFWVRDEFRERGRAAWRRYDCPGYYRSKVAIVGVGQIARHLMKLLRAFDMDVIAVSRHLSDGEAAELGARKADIDTAMREADVVTLLASNIPENRHMVDAGRLRLMKPGAVLINTGRGALVDEEALLAELASGRIRAILDVTDPEPPAPGSPLYKMENVVLTPHVAGSVGPERLRLGEKAADEVERFIRGEPLLNPVDEATLDKIA